MNTGQIPNPHYVGAPARMADGRLFTDYRRSTKLLPPLMPGTWAEWERRQSMQQMGVAQINTNRMTSTLQAGSTNCVDTMVPELSKWVYDWNGGRQMLAHPVGIGAGRLYLPGRTDLVTADPDVLAAATFPSMPGTWSPNPQQYVAAAVQPTVVDVPVVTARKNRYAAPYGNR